jgi:hypothetical protein
MAPAHLPAAGCDIPAVKVTVKVTHWVKVASAELWFSHRWQMLEYQLLLHVLCM